ncbi:MAG: SPFH domain-containing protein [Planctomycetota bacterium]
MSEEENHTQESKTDEEKNTWEPVGHKALADALGVSFKALKVGMAVLIVLYLAQGFFFVDTDEVRIKLRFGRPVAMQLGQQRGEGYVMDSASGWHYAWPWEEVVTVPLSEKNVEVKQAFSPAQGQQAGEGEGLNPKADNYLITGDVNIIYMQLRASYLPRSDEEGAMDYAFRMRPPEVKMGDESVPAPDELLRRMVMAATIETVASWGVLDVRGKTKEVPAPSGEGKKTVRLFAEIESRVRDKLEEFEDKNGYSTGIELTGIERMEDPEVPDSVKPAFDMYQQAESQKRRLIDEGEERARSIITNAQGRKSEILAEARSFRERLKNVAQSDASMLTQLSSVYEESPSKAAILREWHYERMIEQLLGQSRGSFVLHETGDDTSRELWLQLEQPRGDGEEEEEEEGDNE